MEHLEFDQSIAHVVYPLLDSKTENIATFFEKFYEVIEKHAKMGNILVHCSAGISRVKHYLSRAPLLSSLTSCARKNEPLKKL